MADVSDGRRSGRVGRARFTAILVALALSSQSTLGWAQSDEERSGARSAAQEGAKAYEEGRFADAIDLFSRAQALVKAPPHLLYIARSHDKLGQLVKAREAYLKITRDKIADDAPQAFRDAQASAQKELAALEPRLPYVSVVVQGAGPLPVTVTMDGQKVPQALVGVPRPVDPGEHKFQGFAEKMETNINSVSLKEGARETVVLTLQEKAGGAGAPVAGTPNAEQTKPVGGEPQADTSAQSGTNSMRIASYAAFGVGAVGLIVGTVFALKAGSKRGEADDLCNAPGGKCPSDKKDQIDSLDKDADSAGKVAVVGFVLGGVGIAAGATLFVLSSKKSSASNKAPAHASISPWIGIGSAGVSGRF